MLLGLFGGAAYGCHVHRMLWVLFDYGLNVAICVAIGLIQVRGTVAVGAKDITLLHP